ncbi:zinc finger protein 576, tandem duplicate 1 [Xenentodon cancila]
MAITPAVEVESGGKSQMKSWKNTATVGKDSAAKPGAPAEPAPDVNAKPGCDEKKAKKQDKGVSEGRKYVLSKKAMVDPLKMDMSKPLVMPLTSSQLSLQCIECHIIFSDPKSKERHLKLSHPAEYEQCILRNALFACYVCDRHFTNSTELMVHQKAHTEKKPFKCPICNQAFKKSSELTAHKKIHFGQDGYACTECGKPCKTLTLLKYHQRTHTGERPYICKDCGKRFTMSKALQKHMVSHLPEGAEVKEDDATEKPKRKKNNGASTVKYPCSLCKATFKSCKTRLRHMKTKHGGVPAAAINAHLAGQQVKQSGPIITPISISQTSLLQVEPNGPLQKVDADIDTEQICKLIESLGNVQKVNQVVILGQVPPNAPPLEVQQLSQPGVSVNVHLSPPQIDFGAESKTTELDPSSNPCDSMEQTIILEPITPDGQLENPSFSELGSFVASGENIELTLVAAGQTEGPEGEVVHKILQQPDIGEIHYDTVLSQNDTDDLKQSLEQTVILELTPALTPTAELEQSQTEPRREIPSSSLLLNTNQETPEQNADQTVTDEQETTLLVPPLTPTVQLELASIIPEQQDLSSCPLAPPETITQAPSESETNSKEDDSDQVHDINEKTQEQAEEEVSEKLPIDSENPAPEVAEQSAKEDNVSQIKTKEAPQNTELPVNVMSAQELVKVRKRKPARTFIFQGYMQDLVGSIYNDDLYFDAKPAKRQRTKKSHLVVKFGPQSKDKKNKKQKKTSQQCQPVQEDLIRSKAPAKKLSGRKAPSKTKGGKGKKDKTVGNMSPGTDVKSPSTQTLPGKQMKEDASKNTMKKQKVSKQSVSRLSEHKAGASPMFKKKKQAKLLRKDQPETAKDGKAKKNMASKEKVKKADGPGSNITEDSLLLLKGHKQPQLKVYKLDPTKASSQTPEVSSGSQTASNQGTSETTDEVPARGKKKGGRAKKNQKALSLLSSLQVSRPAPETQPAKPKTTRKRKASSKVETEGVITSKKSLVCKDCGEKFTDVSSLQKHKTDAHIIESPSLTYTNGNIFEGVSRLEFYQLPKEHHKVVGVKNPATDWDTEPEMGEMTSEEREQSLEMPDRTISTKTQTSPNFKAIKATATAPTATVPSIPPTLEESPEEPVVFELESLTTSVEEVMNEGGLQGERENGRETGPSPGIILERFLTSRQREAADEETCLMEMSPNERWGLDGIADNEVEVLGSQEIKIEDHSSDPLLVAPTCQSRQSVSVQLQHHRDVRTVLVKEESSPVQTDVQNDVQNDVQAAQGSKQMRWNVEPVSNEQTDMPLIESGETTGDCRITPEFNTSQCIFYPVKEEEREVLLGAAQTSGERSTPRGTGDESQPGHQSADCDSYEGGASAPEYQETMRGLLSEPGVDDFANSQAVSDSEWQHPSDLRNFLLQSSDEEDMSGFDLSDPQHDTEAEVMACFNKNQTSSAEKAAQTSSNLPTSSNQLQATADDGRTGQPINYFSKYFSWDTWAEIATCTNNLTNTPNPITSKEVACFVGIHIGMGTLKFPSPRLYWEDLTKVPLISEAMPLTRFLELSRTLKLTSPSNDPTSSNVNSHKQGATCSHGQSVISQHNDEQCQRDKTHDLNSSQTQSDPLWKVQPLLCHFNAGCRSLRRQGDYAVDQYSLPLTANTHINRPSLLCTTLIGFGGLVLNVDLKLDLSDKEDAVEKMVPKGSMVFLCKQELSTPAMLERLLVAGVHGAGRVGGARGQIGDEFVSSDGKLMLRRSHCGFILSTAGNSQRSLPSLIDSFEKAQMSARLNRDLQNLYLIPLTASAASCWPQAVLWYLTDLALVNSWLQYRQDHGAALAPLTLMAFRLEVSKALILSSSTETQDSVPPQPPSEKASATNETPTTPIAVEESPLPDAATRYDGSGHWPEQLGEGEGGRCRFGNCQRTSRVLCLKCCVFLCISRNHNCFLNFHNQETLRKEQ